MLFIAHSTDDSANITFLGTGKPNNSFDLLYCDICLIVMLWDRTPNICEVSCTDTCYGTGEACELSTMLDASATKGSVLCDCMGCT